MIDFIRKRLIEAIKSRHWEGESYPNRIMKSTFGDLGSEAKKTVDDRIEFLESLEFDNNGDKIGIWLYNTPVPVTHPPFSPRDKGSHLLAIMNDNIMTTLYWKHKYEGQYDLDINYKDLVDFSKSEFYDPQKMPINIKNIKTWKKKLRGTIKQEINVNRFKKLKLSNGTPVRYYEGLNKFETLEGQPIDIFAIANLLPDNINVDDIILDTFARASENEKVELIDKIPEHLQNKVMELMESIELPVEIGDTVLMGKFKNKKVIIKDIEWDEEKGDLKINGKPALKMRLTKKLDKK